MSLSSFFLESISERLAGPRRSVGLPSALVWRAGGIELSRDARRCRQPVPRRPFAAHGIVVEDHLGRNSAPVRRVVRRLVAGVVVYSGWSSVSSLFGLRRDSGGASVTRRYRPRAWRLRRCGAG